MYVPASFNEQDKQVLAE